MLLSNDVTCVNQILPHKNKWAWDLFLKGQANNWVPTEVPMAKDIEQWRANDVLTDDERLLLRRCFGFFAGSESLVANNLLLNIFRWVNDGECRSYIGRQHYEEQLHNQTVVYVCDSLGLDEKEIYEAYKSIPSIKAKDDFLMELTAKSVNLDLDTIEGRREVLRAIITYYLICEGTFFYSGFVMLLSFGRQNKMPGVSEQVQLTLRDEGVHVEFGVKLINKIISEEPSLWTKEFQKDTVEHFKKTVELEVQYAHDVLPRGVLGLNAELFLSYMQYVATRRIESIGLKSPWKNTRNPFPWMSEVIDLQKQKNFFETRVTDYAVGNFVDDL